MVKEDGSCPCIDETYKWTGSACEFFKCASIDYVKQDGTHEETIQRCECQDKFTWDSTLKECVIDCTAVTGTLKTSSNDTIHSCQCQAGSVWEKSALMCIRNCSAVAHALPENINDEECLCEDKFVWEAGQCKTTCG